jgi:hypothetical protein
MNTRTAEQEIHLYTADTLDQLEWPDTEEGLYAKQYFTPLVKEGISQYVENINASLAILKIQHQVYPILIVNNEYTNSYVCSPYGHYISLALESLHLLENNFLRIGAKASLKSMGKLLKLGKINNILYINHWLFSTDLHSHNIEECTLQTIIKFLTKKFPQHAIAFRSINSKNHPEFKEYLKKSRFSLLLSRHVYLTDTSDDSIFSTRILKSDLKLLRESDFEIIENEQLQQNEYQRALELYNLLSIEHHSKLNPQLSLRFIRYLIEEKLLRIKALKKNGTIEGIIGYVERGQTLFCPFIGYDKQHPDKTKLYRLLTTSLLLEARKKKCLMHQSAGASFYKTIRRAVGYQEYLGVYTRHLPYNQKFAWGLLRNVMNLAAAPMMKKY